MKIRSCFVSNSSSSSFVAVGFLVKKEERTKEPLRLLDEYVQETYDSSEDPLLDYFGESSADDIKKDHRFLGRILCTIDLEDFGSADYSLVELNKEAEEIKELLNSKEIFVGEPIVTAGWMAT